jgi:predicted NBD/HSP70 family sugar kinase
VATVKYAGQRDYGQLFVALRHDLAGRAGVAASDIRAAGVAVAGIVDGDTGRIVLCPNICDLPAFDLCGIMSEALGLDDVRIENDVNLAAVGEHLRGVAQGCDNLFS